MTAARPDDTAPIRPEEQFDEAVVAVYLQSELPELFGSGELHFDQFPGGAANLTYRVYTDNGDEYVLRRAPLGKVAKGGHDMEREHRVLSRIWAEYPEAPRAYHYCADPGIIGKPFFVMERRHGHVIRSEWPESFADPQVRRRAAANLVQGLARLHQVDPAAVGLDDLGRPEGFVIRQVEGWAQRWEAAATREVAAMAKAADLLRANLPVPQAATILHNDYKLDNTMMNDAGELVAVFDWDMATRGDPLVDLGTLLAYWADPDDPTFLIFGEMAVSPAAEFPKPLVVEQYAATTGFDVAAIDYYEGLALYRIAVIIEQIYARYRAGQTSDQRFARFEPLAPLLAAAAVAKLA